MKLEDKINEWDFKHLIVLDDCRYDTFKEYNTIEGNLEKLISPGSGTYEVLENTFTGYYPDVKVFSQHPIINEKGITPDDFIKRTIERAEGDYNVENKWISTEHFDNIIKLDRKQRYPFEPFKEVYDEEVFLDSNIHWVMSPHMQFIDSGKSKDSYDKTVKHVLDKTKKVIDNFLDGKIVVTSDHGECFESVDTSKGRIGHPVASNRRVLREVPWLEVEQ